MFGEHAFYQTIDIPMGTKCASPVTNFFLRPIKKLKETIPIFWFDFPLLRWYPLPRYILASWLWWSHLSHPIELVWFDLIYCVLHHFQQYFSYIMTISVSRGGSQCTRRELPTIGKQLVSFITCICESNALLFATYKAGHEPSPYWWSAYMSC